MKHLLMKTFIVLLAFVSLRAFSGPPAYEQQLSRVYEGFYRLVDERGKTPEGTMRYMELEKAIGQIEQKAGTTRDYLDSWETVFNHQDKKQLETTILTELKEMEYILREAPIGWP